MTQDVSAGVSIQGDSISVVGDIVGRDKIINNIQHIQQRALTFAEESAKEQELETRKLAQGVSAFIQRLRSRAETVENDPSPYKGLLEYRLSDAEIFFGRERAIGELLKSLTRSSLTVLHAESGAGKSSLLQAGISPRLIATGHLPVYLRPYRDDPTLIIKRAFLADPSLTPTLATAPLRDFLRQVCDIIGGQTTLYIFLDQFEEFFTQRTEAERAEFVLELAECLDDATLNVRWLLAMRTEYFGNLANFRPRIRNPFENDCRLNRLTRAEAQTVISEPARRRGVRFEDGLISALLDDLGKNEIAPPQIQLVCGSLYEELEEGKKIITREMYEREGKAAGILRGHLERVLSRDLLPPQRAAARRLLETLITSEMQRVIRTYVELVAELAQRGVPQETLEIIVNQLVDSRLLRVEEGDNGLAYELAHDYLLSEIKLDPDVQARKAAQELLEQETRAYTRFKTLLTEDRLKVIEPYQKELRFTPEAQQLFEASRAKLKQEQQAHERRRNILVAGAITIAIVMTLLGLFGLNRSIEADKQRDEAQRQAKIALSRQLAAQSQTHLSDQLDLSLLLGVEADRMPNIFEARYALSQGLNQNPPTYLRGHKESVRGVAFSADGKTMASGSADATGTIILWDVTNPKSPVQLSVFGGHKDALWSIAFSPDGKILASSSRDKTVILWDVANPKSPAQLSVLAGSTDLVTSIAFTPDGKTLASGNRDKTITLWDVANSKSPSQLSTFGGHTDFVWAVAFSMDGKTLASGSRDKTVILWDVTNLKSPAQLSKLTSHKDFVYSVVFSADGKTMATGSADRTTILWDITNPKSPTQLSVLAGHKDYIDSVAFSADGKRLATASYDKTVMLWDITNLKSPTQLNVFEAHKNIVYSVAFSMDGKTLASGSYDATVILWDVANSKSPLQLSVWTGHKNSVNSAVFSADGKTLASGSADNTIMLWDVTNPRSPTQLSALTGHKGIVNSVAYSADGKMLASGSADNTIILWDVTNLKSPMQLSVLTGHKGVVHSVVFNADGKTLASGSADNTIILWDITNPKSPVQLSVLTGHRNIVLDVAFSRDGKKLATGGYDRNIILWDVTNLKVPTQLNVLAGHKDHVTSLVFNSDGKTLASGGEDIAIMLWDVMNVNPSPQLSVLVGHEEFVNAVAFSADGKMLASGSRDRRIILWDVTNPKSPTQASVFLGLKGAVNSLAFSADGKMLASGSSDGALILWNLDVESWKQSACNMVRRNLTQAEWKQYLRDELYRKTCEEFPAGE